jgi:hypothetical protein
MVLSGCTGVLWDKNTFASYYRPAQPNNLALFYSGERKDILVRYDEFWEGGTNTRPRCYWLDPNTVRINNQEKPHFVSPIEAQGLTPIPVLETRITPAPASLQGLYAVARHDDDYFILWSKDEELNPYKLPRYKGSSQTVKQVLLTPGAVAVDLTIIGAVAAVYYSPYILAGYSH